MRAVGFNFIMEQAASLFRTEAPDFRRRNDLPVLYVDFAFGTLELPILFTSSGYGHIFSRMYVELERNNEENYNRTIDSLKAVIAQSV
jgi:hypothetical protein